MEFYMDSQNQYAVKQSKKSLGNQMRGGSVPIYTPLFKEIILKDPTQSYSNLKRLWDESEREFRDGLMRDPVGHMGLTNNDYPTRIQDIFNKKVNSGDEIEEAEAVVDGNEDATDEYTDDIAEELLGTDDESVAEPDESAIEDTVEPTDVPDVEVDSDVADDSSDFEGDLDKLDEVLSDLG
jgi:hypothetical protein